MKQKIIILFFLISFNIFAQKESKIDYISFKYNISNVLFSEVEVSIIENGSLGNKTFNLEAKYYEGIKKRKKKKTISKEDFNSIIEAVCKINNSDLIENFSNGFDGSTTELEFGTVFYNSINFKLWSVSKRQNNTKLKDFIEAVQLILKVTEIEIEDYN
ncbi:hypothetical protein ACFO3U_09435 [Flavobacterium ponti]|uniref:Uncharacterized protein n=1 Tax=Flavobacterium ponti TaxID=665133 RepID=A0ABV9P807_9FLAO